MYHVCTSDAERRYSSPSPDDPRLIDCIFHATFICARVHCAMARQATLPAVDGSLAAQANAQAEIQQHSFHRGLVLVWQHRTRSPTGARADRLRRALHGKRPYLTVARSDRRRRYRRSDAPANVNVLMSRSPMPNFRMYKVQSPCLEVVPGRFQRYWMAQTQDRHA